MERPGSVFRGAFSISECDLKREKKSKWKYYSTKILESGKAKIVREFKDEGIKATLLSLLLIIISQIAGQ